jgi:hypothetical protein
MRGKFLLLHFVHCGSLREGGSDACSRAEASVIFSFDAR